MLKMSLVTPYKKVLTDVPVEEVILPAFLGQLEILPGHAPLMTTLTTGVVKYKVEGGSDFKKAAVSWGYIEVANNVVNILAETAETEEDLDQNRVSVAFEKAVNLLDSNELDMNQIEKFQRKLKRAEARKELFQN